MSWAGDAARMGEKRNANKTLAGNYEGQRSLGRAKRTQEDNFRTDTRDI